MNDSISTGATAGRALEGVDVLVVEDDPLSREALELVLSAHGASVHSAQCVSEALSLFDEASPHVVISDIGLPGADGYELIRQIRGRERAAGQRIAALALSGFCDASSARARAAGFDGFLSKPVDIDALVARLRRLANA